MIDIMTHSVNGRDYIWGLDDLPIFDPVPVDIYQPILDNLQEFEIAKHWPKRMRMHRMKAGWCFNNAISTWMRYGLRYVEGFKLNVLSDDMEIWFHHAWNLDADDKVIDRTQPKDRYRYVGAVIENKDLRDWVWNVIAYNETKRENVVWPHNYKDANHHE